MQINKRHLRWIGLGGAGVILLGLASGAILLSGKPPRPATVTARIGDLEQDVLATGSLEPLKLVSVGAQASGQLIALHVQLGDTVHKGDLIAEIDAASQRNALLTAEAALRNVQAQRAEALANLAQASLAFRRQADLVKLDAVARADYETAEASYKADKAKLEEIDAQIASARVSVQSARVNLGYTRIVAPMDGTVVAVVTKEGQTVNANLSAPTIVKLAQLDTMTVKAQISEADVINVKPGQAVYFTILGAPDQKYFAKLRAIEPAPVAITDADSVITSSSSSANAIYYIGRFEVPNPTGRLRTFMTAQVTVVTDEVRHAVVIPTSALGAKAADGTYTVMVVESDRKAPVRRTVKIGINTGASAEVLSGLKAGESVALNGAAAPDLNGMAKDSSGRPAGSPSPMGI